MIIILKFHLNNPGEWILSLHSPLDELSLPKIHFTLHDYKAAARDKTLLLRKGFVYSF